MLVRATVALASFATTIQRRFFCWPCAVRLCWRFYSEFRDFRIILGIFAFIPGIPFSLLVLTSLFRLPILLSLYLLCWLALGVTAAALLFWWPLLSCLRGFSFCSSSAVSSSYFCYGCCQLLLSLLGVSVQLVLVHLLRPLSGGCLSLHWQAWRDRDAEPWVVEVLRVGYCLPFLSTPPLSNVPVPMPSSSPTSIKGLFWRRSPWASLPRVLWSFIRPLLQTSTAVCS